MRPRAHAHEHRPVAATLAAAMEMTDGAAVQTSGTDNVYTMGELEADMQTPPASPTRVKVSAIAESSLQGDGAFEFFASPSSEQGPFGLRQQGLLWTRSKGVESIKLAASSGGRLQAESNTEDKMAPATKISAGRRRWMLLLLIGIAVLLVLAAAVTGGVLGTAYGAVGADPDAQGAGAAGDVSTTTTVVPTTTPLQPPFWTRCPAGTAAYLSDVDIKRQGSGFPVTLLEGVSVELPRSTAGQRLVLMRIGPDACDAKPVARSYGGFKWEGIQPTPLQPDCPGSSSRGDGAGNTACTIYIESGAYGTLRVDAYPESQAPVKEASRPGCCSC